MLSSLPRYFVLALALNGGAPAFAAPLYKLPCADQIRKAKSPPAITLVGEKHDDELSKKVQIAALRDAAAGNSFLLTEPLRADSWIKLEADLGAALAAVGAKRSTANRIFGIESTFALATTSVEVLREKTALLAADASESEKSAHMSYAGGALMTLATARPYLDGFLEAYAKAEGTGTFDKALAAKLLAFLQAPRDAYPMRDDRLRAVLRDALGEDWASDKAARESLVRFLDRLLRDMVHTAANTRELEDAVPPGFKERFDAHAKKDERKAIFYLILLEWRDRVMARNIASRYCHALDEGKPLYAITGAMHTPGILRHLKEIFEGLDVTIDAKFSSSEENPKLRKGAHE